MLGIGASMGMARVAAQEAELLTRLAPPADNVFLFDVFA